MPPDAHTMECTPQSPIFDLQLHSAESPARLRPAPGAGHDSGTALDKAFPFPKRSSQSSPCFGSRELWCANERHCLRSCKSLRTGELEPLDEHAAHDVKPPKREQPLRMVGFCPMGSPSLDEARDDTPGQGVSGVHGQPVLLTSSPSAGRSVASPPPTVVSPNMESPTHKMLVSRAAPTPYEGVLLFERRFATGSSARSPQW